MLHLNPIIVDSSHNVIDGQHRLVAAKELKLPVFYVVDSSVSDIDIAGLNSNKKNWSAKDYVEYFSKKGVEGYLTIKKLIEQFPKISYPAAMEYLNNDKWNSSLFREGKFVANNYDGAKDLLSKASDFDFYESRYDQRFLRALKQCIETGEYNHQKMLSQMMRESGRMRLKKCYFHGDYILMLEDIYNFKQQTEIANFRLTRAKREKIATRKEKENKPEKVKEAKPVLIKSPKPTKSRAAERKFAENFLKKQKINSESQKVKTIPVKIDSKTTILVAPGTDIEALKRKYKKG